MAAKCQQCSASHLADELVKGEICPTRNGPYQVRNYKTVAAMPQPLVNKYFFYKNNTLLGKFILKY
jgi:hypothetical protein